MRARFVLEKFTEDGDPIRDMGIGIMYQIEKWIKGFRLWRYPDINDTDDVLQILIANSAPDEYIDYLIHHKQNYDKDKILARCFHSNKKNFVDDLIKLGAKLKTLEDKAQYIVELHGKLLTFTPEERLFVACASRNYNEFVKCIEEDGTKLKIGMINSIFNGKYPYATSSFNANPQKDEILDYLRDNIDNLEELVHPSNYKKIDKIKMFLGVKISTERKEYSMGYKTYRLLKFVNDTNPSTTRELSKFIYELTYGPGTFNPLTNGSYWCDGLTAALGGKTQPKQDGKMFLNGIGLNKLAVLEKKFGPMNIKAYV